MQIVRLLAWCLLLASTASAQDFSWGLVMSGGPVVELAHCEAVGHGSEVIEVIVPGPGTGETIARMPGDVSYLDIACVREATPDRTLAEWRRLVVEGQVAQARHDGCLQILGNTGLVMAQWNLAAAWPLQLRTEVSAAGATESVVLAHEALERAEPISTLAEDDGYETSIATALTVATPGVLGNDGAGSCGQLRAELVSQPASGTVELAADGSFLLTPAPEFSGILSFTYRACTGFDCAAAEVRVGVGVPVPVELQSISVASASIMVR